MRILMLVATTVATDTRVLREATTLVGGGHTVHVIGRSVPEGFQPPRGVSVSSVGTSSVFRAEGAPSLTGRRLSAPMRLARWALLPRHRRSAFGRWATGAVQDGSARKYDVVHAHDFTALEAGAALADRAGVPLVYDTHELWSGRPREHRPTPLLDRRERAVENRLGSKAAAVITVGDGVAEVLRHRYGWTHITVIRNTFPAPGSARRGPDHTVRPRLDDTVPRGADDTGLPRLDGAVPRGTDDTVPAGLVYAGRLAAYRELEVIAAASERLALPVTLIGPADPAWLASFEPGRCAVLDPCPPDDVDAHLVAAGLVLVTHSDRWENYRLAMPNKLFHAVRAGVPVVATDVGELAKVVREHQIGTLYRPGDADDLVRAVEEAVANYPALRVAVAAAAPALSWERDGHRLLDLYAGLSGAVRR